MLQFPARSSNRPLGYGRLHYAIWPASVLAFSGPMASATLASWEAGCSHSPTALQFCGITAASEATEDRKRLARMEDLWLEDLDAIPTGIGSGSARTACAAYFKNGEQVGEWTTYDKTGAVYKVTKPKGARLERIACSRWLAKG